MSGKRHRKTKRDPMLTRRYVARVVQRARDEILHAIVMAEPVVNPPIEPERLLRAVGSSRGGRS